MSLHTHLTQIHESVSGLVKPADLQGFLNHVSGYNFNSLPRATEDAIPASLLHLDQMLMYHNMNFTNHTGQLLLSGTSGLAHTNLMHLTILNIFLVVLMNWNKSTKINGGIIFRLRRQNPSLDSN